MRHALLALALIGASPVLAADGSVAQSTETVKCGNLEQGLANLHETYGETVVFRGEGIDNYPDASVIVTQNLDTGTWTMIGSQRGGRSCILFSGTNKPADRS